jgi:hypothetical protein
MAGFTEIEGVSDAHQELLDAGLSSEELMRRYAAEVDFGKCKATLRRRKRCWSVRASIALPYEIAERLNREWGQRIRVRGGRSNTPLKEREAVLLWEVDDAEALRVLIQTLRDHFSADVPTNY